MTMSIAEVTSPYKIEEIEDQIDYNYLEKYNAVKDRQELEVIRSKDLDSRDIIFWEVPTDIYTMDEIKLVHKYLKGIFPNNKIIILFGKISVIKNKEEK